MCRLRVFLRMLGPCLVFQVYFCAMCHSNYLIGNFKFHLFHTIIRNDQNGCSYSFYYALCNVSAVRLHHTVLTCLKSLILDTVSSPELCGIFFHVVIITEV